MSVIVDKAMVEKVAGLSKLSISSSEVPKYQKHLNSILGYVEALQSVDLSRVDALDLPESSDNRCDKGVFREDSPIPSKPINSILDQAPLVKGSSFQVPQIIE